MAVRPIDGELLKNAIQSWIDTQSEFVDVETCAMVLAAIAVMPTLTLPNEIPPCYQPDGDGCAYQCYDGQDEPIDKCKECPLCYSDKQRHHASPNEWVSVEERLPKYNIREDGELVSSKILCYCETDKTVHLAVSQKFYIGRMGEIVHPIFRYYDEWGYEVENVSHWMPLPEPPKEETP